MVLIHKHNHGTQQLLSSIIEPISIQWDVVRLVV